MNKLQHDLVSPNRNSRALPFLDIEPRANYGDVYVSLPHCFRGLITIRTGYDRIALSPALEEGTALISDVPHLRVYFVGDRPDVGKWGNDGDNSDNDGTVEDSLDELSVSGRYSSVRINWDGEEEVLTMIPSGWQGFCGGAERFIAKGRVR